MIELKGGGFAMTGGWCVETEASYATEAGLVIIDADGERNIDLQKLHKCINFGKVG